MKVPLATSSVLLLAAAIGPATIHAEDFRSVMRILEDKCFKCHSESERVKGGLALDEDEISIAIGPYHPVVPGKADESDLYLMAAYADTHDPMPPRGKGDKLSSSELKKLKEWIDAGALLPGQDPPEDDGAMAESTLPTEILDWTNDAGNAMRASLVQLAGDEVVFRLEDGRTTNYPLGKLSPESQAKVKELASPSGG